MEKRVEDIRQVIKFAGKRMKGETKGEALPSFSHL